MLLIVILVQRRLILLAAEKHLGYQEWPENGYQPHDALIADCSATSSFPALLPLVIVAYRHKNSNLFIFVLNTSSHSWMKYSNRLRRRSSDNGAKPFAPVRLPSPKMRERRTSACCFLTVSSCPVILVYAFSPSWAREFCTKVSNIIGFWQAFNIFPLIPFLPPFPGM